MGSVGKWMGWVALAGLVIAGCGDDRPPPVREGDLISSSGDGDPDDSNPSQPDASDEPSHPVLPGHPMAHVDGGSNGANDPDGGGGSGNPSSPQSSVPPILVNEPPCSAQGADAGSDEDGDHFTIKEG